MKPGSGLLISSLLLPFALASTATQAADEEPVRCISLSRIDRTEVIDDRTIAFFLKGGDVYVNRLGRTCYNLEREGRFSYRTSAGQLCNIDTITVLEDSVIGLNRGATCGLGMFMPADEDLLDMLRTNEEPADVTVEEIEVDEEAPASPAADTP